MNRVSPVVGRVKLHVFRVELEIMHLKVAVYRNVQQEITQTFKKENAYRKCQTSFILVLFLTINILRIEMLF